MTNPYPIARDKRETEIYTASASQTVFGPTPFKIWDLADLEVWLQPAGGNWQKLDAGWNSSKTADDVYDTASVTLDTARAAGDKVAISSKRLHERTGSVTQGGTINSVALEREFDRIATIMQEVRRDLDDQVQLQPDSLAFDAQGKRIVGLGNGVDDQDAVTLFQLNEIAGSAEIAVAAKIAAEEAKIAAEAAAGFGTIYLNRDAALLASPPAVTITIGYYSQNGQLCLFFKDSQGTALQTANGERWSPAFDVTPAHFGTNNTGLADDTAIIRAMHEYANATKRNVSYAGTDIVYIDADAEIQISTSVDFANAVIKARDGIVVSPAFGTITKMFIVSDSATPLVTGTQAVTGSNLAIGSYNYTADYFDGPGYVYFSDNSDQVSIVSRDTLTTVPFRYSAAIGYDGRSVHPLPVDMSSVTSVYAEYRAMPETGLITIENINHDINSFNNATVLRIERNMVDVRNFCAVPSVGESQVASVNRLIDCYGCSNLSFTNVIAPPQLQSADGSYVYHFRKCAEVRMDNVSAIGPGWGCMASDHLSGFYLQRSTVNRIDGHNGLHNVSATDCTFHDIGIVYGWGTGFIVAENCRTVECPVVSTRVDYGGYFWGEIIVNNARASFNDFTVYAVNIEVGVAMPTSTAIFNAPVPNVIVDGFTVRQLKTDNGSIQPVRIVVRAGSAQAPVAPAIVSANNVFGSGDWRFECYIDILNMQNNGGDRKLIKLSNIAATRACTIASQGLVPPANFISGISAYTIKVEISDVRFLSMDYSAKSADVTVAGGSVNQLQIFTARNLTASNITFETPFSGATQFGAVAASGTSQFGTNLNGGRISGSASLPVWDFSLCQAITGLYIGDATGITLPAGATQANVYTGWRD
ncbi:MAG: hypothetical protein JJ891_16755 [Rhizobiaceae bacterium]|nr:hypothetical protein [Rhizobiaceae bacterium]